MFMIYLIISLPIVFAQELSIQKFQGKDNARGYARIKDELTVEALARIPGEDTISKEQLRLYWGQMYTTFDNCNETTGGYYTCTMYEPQFESYEPLDLTVELRDDSDNIVGQEAETLQIDNLAPAITEMSVDPPISNGEVILSYVAEDYALTTGDTTTCSGLKSITIKEGANLISTDTAGLGECIKDNQVRINFETAGTKQICITALDHVNFASPPRCKEVKIDKAAPNIQKLDILDEQGFILTHVHSGETRNANINAVITDDGEVAQDTVFANLEQLNPELTELIPPDIIENDIYSWRIPISEASPCKITITATDSLGNTNTKDFTCNIKADDIPPTYIQLISDSERDGIPLYGYGTQLILEFEDKDNNGNPGIGLQNRNVYLDMTTLGMGPVEPDVCSATTGAEWQCSWFLNPPLTTPEGTYEIILQSDSADDLGNQMGTEHAIQIIYDNTGPSPPEIIEHKVVTGEAGAEYAGGAVRGDYVKYKVRSREFTTAYANFSDLGAGEKEPATLCEDAEGGAKDCTFETIVALDGPFTADIGFSFYDDANNKASTTTTLEIYAIEDSLTADYWKTPTITCSPRVVDRKTATIIPTPVTCRLDLSTPNDKVSTLAIAGPSSPDQCTGDVDLNVNDIYMINTAEGSTSPYIFITLEPKEYLRNSLNIVCPITIYSKREETTAGTTRYYVTRQPQTIDANITLQFYNNPMGTAYDSIDKKIERSIDDAWNNQQWLGTLRQVLYYAELICWIKQMIVSVIAAMYLVVTLLTPVAGVLKLVTYTKGAGDFVAQVAVGVCGTEEELSETIFGEAGAEVLAFLNSICSIVNCGATGGYQTGAGYLGGGVPWCQDPLKIKEWSPALKKVSESSGISIMPNIKDSLILSTLCLCLPGIVYNVEKLRQVHCFRTVCLYDYTKQQGYPVDYCDEMHDYFVCTFVVGEIFSMLPFVGFFDKLIDMVVTFISDPVALFTTALGGICENLCEDKAEPVPLELIAFIGCALLKTLSVIMESTAAIKKMTDTESDFGKAPGGQYCDRVEKIKEEIEKSKQE